MINRSKLNNLIFGDYKIYFSRIVLLAIALKQQNYENIYFLFNNDDKYKITIIHLYDYLNIVH